MDVARGIELDGAARVRSAAAEVRGEHDVADWVQPSDESVLIASKFRLQGVSAIYREIRRGGAAGDGDTSGRIDRQSADGLLSRASQQGGVKKCGAIPTELEDVGVVRSGRSGDVGIALRI